MEKITLSDNIERIVLNPKTDNCPICDTPLKDVSYSWNMFHGSAKANCCHADYQVKSFYVNPEKQKKDIVEYVEALDRPDKIQLKIDSDWIEPIKMALKATGRKYIEQVQDEAEKFRKEIDSNK